MAEQQSETTENPDANSGGRGGRGGQSAKPTKVVRYTGTSDVREIDSAAFKRAGIEDQNKVVWSATNGHTVQASDISPAAVDFLGKADGFKVEDVEG